jgi:putative ubiquitin-RnfH superfamily antitoxin RatB of RatAB toxin-antitoxin module
MRVGLKCFANLAKKYDCHYGDTTPLNMQDGESVQDALRASGIAQSDVKLIFVNGRLSNLSQPLQDGDRLALAPATGGM